MKPHFTEEALAFESQGLPTLICLFLVCFGVFGSVVPFGGLL